MDSVLLPSAIQEIEAIGCQVQFWAVIRVIRIRILGSNPLR